MQSAHVQEKFIQKLSYLEYICTVLAVNNVAWYISMSYAKGDHCKIKFKVGMCEGECYTRDLAVLSSFKHL